MRKENKENILKMPADYWLFGKRAIPADTDTTLSFFSEKSLRVSIKGCTFAPNMLPPLPVRTAQSGEAIYFVRVPCYCAQPAKSQWTMK